MTHINSNFFLGSEFTKSFQRAQNYARGFGPKPSQRELNRLDHQARSILHGSSKIGKNLLSQAVECHKFLIPELRAKLSIKSPVLYSASSALKMIGGASLFGAACGGMAKLVVMLGQTKDPIEKEGPKKEDPEPVVEKKGEPKKNPGLGAFFLNQSNNEDICLLDQQPEEPSPCLPENLESKPDLRSPVLEEKAGFAPLFLNDSKIEDTCLLYPQPAEPSPCLPENLESKPDLRSPVLEEKAGFAPLFLNDSKIEDTCLLYPQPAEPSLCLPENLESNFEEKAGLGAFFFNGSKPENPPLTHAYTEDFGSKTHLGTPILKVDKFSISSNPGLETNFDTSLERIKTIFSNIIEKSPFTTKQILIGIGVSLIALAATRKIYQAAYNKKGNDKNRLSAAAKKIFQRKREQFKEQQVKKQKQEIEKTIKLNETKLLKIPNYRNLNKNQKRELIDHIQQIELPNLRKDLENVQKEIDRMSINKNAK